MKRRKPKALRKDEVIRLRVTTEQKRALVQASAVAGLDVSAWLRSLALREAGRALRPTYEPETP